MRIPAHRIQLSVLYLLRLPQETEKPLVSHGLYEKERVTVPKRPRELVLRQNAVKVIPSVAAMNRHGRNPNRIPYDNDCIAWNGPQTNDGLRLRLIDGGQIPVALLQLFY